MSRYKAYPEYKESEVEWLGEVPAHWRSRQLKYLCSYNDEVLSETVGNDYEIEYVDIGSVSATDGISGTETLLFGDAPSRARRIVRDGDVLISTVRTYLEAIASIQAPPNNLIASTGFAVIRPNALLDKGYAAYCLRASGFIKEVVARSVGVSYPAINASDLVDIKTPEPSLIEQEKIAAFLDHETAKIDALIEKQQRLIELLKEKRQAVISHAVTKGLNPNAPMKDSGVEWLGQVPAHWVVGKCGFHVSILSGYAFQSSGFSDNDEDTKLLRGINVGVNSLKWDEVVYWKRKPSDGLDAYVMQEGDIVIGMDRPLISDGIRVAKVKESDLPCLLLQRVASIKTSEHLDADYLLMLLSSNMFSAHFAPDTTGVSVPHISPDQIGNFVIPIPTVDEQKRIVFFVSSESRKLLELLSKAEAAISLMKERRTALISAAVTGKIDVRDWQAAA